MLKHLTIHNIILIETASIAFSRALNVLSGETGSGKSALLNALRLIAGEKADTGIIRKGCEKGVVEAAFSIDANDALHTILDESGIDYEAGHELLIKREINSCGKSRAFINHQQAQISLLKKVGACLVDIVGQHDNHRLFSIDHHREILDLYANLEQDGKDYKKAFEKERHLEMELEALKASESERIREIEICRIELEEIAEANLKEGEEEELFSEYSLLANAEEINQKIDGITHLFYGDRLPILALLSKQQIIFDQLIEMLPALKDAAESYANALIELKEIGSTLTSYQTKIQSDPKRLHELNERLSLISKLKRKYGQTIDAIISYQKARQDRLTLLENADTRIEELASDLKDAAAQTNRLASNLSKKRQAAGKPFQNALTGQLNALNMPKSEFVIEVTPQKRTIHGDDRVEFYLIPNIGEHRIAVKDGVSGGEISRILLSIQTLLAGKALVPTLIFDEVDANIGGKTASIVGDKLKEISAKHQVLCITHFPQVASQAEHHLQISKQEKEGRTIAEIRAVSGELRMDELRRMMGGSAAMHI